MIETSVIDLRELERMHDGNYVDDSGRYCCFSELYRYLHEEPVMTTDKDFEIHHCKSVEGALTYWIIDDGYSFQIKRPIDFEKPGIVYKKKKKDSRIVAGCRNFSLKEACEWWGNTCHHAHKRRVKVLKALFKARGIKRKHIPEAYRHIFFPA